MMMKIALVNEGQGILLFRLQVCIFLCNVLDTWAGLLRIQVVMAYD